MPGLLHPFEKNRRRSLKKRKAGEKEKTGYLKALERGYLSKVSLEFIFEIRIQAFIAPVSGFDSWGNAPDLGDFPKKRMPDFTLAA